MANCRPKHFKREMVLQASEYGQQRCCQNDISQKSDLLVPYLTLVIFQVQSTLSLSLCIIVLFRIWQHLALVLICKIILTRISLSMRFLHDLSCHAWAQVQLRLGASEQDLVPISCSFPSVHSHLFLSLSLPLSHIKILKYNTGNRIWHLAASCLNLDV